jgi:hypothetical protein
MKKNSIEKKTYIRKFTTAILRARRKKPIICKKHSYTFKYLKFIFKLPKINKGPMQVLARALKKHN